MENESFISLISCFGFFLLSFRQRSTFLVRDHASCNHTNGGYQRGCWITLLTVHICSSLMLSAWLISDHHTNFFKSCHDFSPRGNEILMHINMRHGLMDDTRRSSWHQCSMLLFRVAVSYTLLHAGIVWFLPDVACFLCQKAQTVM